LESPSVVLLAEGDSYWPALKGMLTEAKVAGPAIHDARIAGLCRVHGVRELWTADRNSFGLSSPPWTTLREEVSSRTPR